jgi:hypothetical protein
MERTASRAFVAQPEQAAAPYPPSWVDRLTAWVARRRGPAWLYYLGMAVLIYAAYLLVKWWDGTPIDFYPRSVVLTVGSTFYYLGVIHYLDDVARNAMKRFRPAIEAPPQRVAELEYRLTTMPPRGVWLMTLIGILEGGLTLAGIVSGVLVYPGPAILTSVPAALLEVTLVMLVGVFFLIGVYHTVHQLQTVSSIYTELTKMDLFNQRPLHAFARLAAYTPIAWLIPQYFWLAAGLESGAFTVALGFHATAMILGAITFIWPLMGIHRLLAAEKDRIQAAASKRLDISLQMFDRALDSGDMAAMDAVGKAIGNAERVRAVVDAIPTWPWQPGLLRGAATAFFLPLIIWVVTRLLERLFSP